MCRAKLIKRNEVAERERANLNAEPEPNIVKTTVDAVLEWKNNRQAARQRNPREVFDALFASHHLTETCD